MAKYELMEPFTAIRGKLGKNCQGPVFHKRALTGKLYTNHMHNPYTGEASEGQRTVRNNFKTAMENVETVLADNALKAAAIERFKAQSKYKYLRNFIFVEELKKLQ